MEEELNEHELEERLYAMLHHVDETQINVTQPTQNQNESTHQIECAPRGTMRRYWRTGNDYNPYRKINKPREPAATANKPATPIGKPVTPVNKPSPLINKPPPPVNKPPPPVNKPTPPVSKPAPAEEVSNVPKEERTSSPPTSTPVDLSIFQSPIPVNLKPTVEIIEHENDNSVLLETSDEDEVVEVELPPKPTITIESSDEDELEIVKPDSPPKTTPKPDNKCSSGERAISASPVPSVVSSVSDEFIRGDCIALNISSRQPDNPSFDFSLHGSDLLMNDTPSKRKKKKKSKEVLTSTPVVASTGNLNNNTDECFATPKSKAKNKRQASKLYTVTETSVPNIDIYDSDSNQSIVDANKTKNPYMVTDRSLPSVDVYESDSSLSEMAKRPKINDADSSDSSTSNNTPAKNDKNTQQKTTNVNSFVDLTANDSFANSICENIVMGNVTGFEEDVFVDEREAPSSNTDISKYVSSKEPSILNEDLDFDNLKGKDTVCKNRKYSLTTLRAEMEKFYNESWGGEDFNHREIQKYMSRDKSLWAIDPKDRMPSLVQRKTRCNYGHRDDTCRQKPAVCYMCGTRGHLETRCPTKICVNCGSPNQLYTNICRNCSSWGGVRCAECGQLGHPPSHCPDLWRRYHNTIDINKPLEKCFQNKRNNQLFCSGCSRRGHLIHTCRTTLPFSGLPINSPYIFSYRAIFTPQNKVNKHIRSFSENNTPPPQPHPNKRQSKSPTAHENHQNKKRNISVSEDDFRRQTNANAQRNTPTTDDANKKKITNKNISVDSTGGGGGGGQEKAADYIPLSSSNHDNKGHMIQDNEVSDTSDVITSARIYVTGDVVDRLKSKEGEEWLASTCNKLNVTVHNSDITSFLNIRGKVGDQEAFQSELREWNQTATKRDTPTNDGHPQNMGDQHLVSNLPKNKNNLLKKLDKALNLLKEDMGDPKSFFNELTYSQNRHEKLLKQKVINPKVLTHSRTHINDVAAKLNVVLLGQAGLADGSQHVNQLYCLKEKLNNIRSKNIPLAVRKQIGEHYQNVFGPTVRNDYSELLKKYYLGHTKQKHVVKPNANANIIVNNVKSIPPQQNMNNVKSIPPQQKMPTNNAVAAINSNHVQAAAHLRKLVFFHRRLQTMQVEGKIRKKERYELVRRMHSLIGCLFKKDGINSKILKKARKTQTQVKKFLTNM